MKFVEEIASKLSLHCSETGAGFVFGRQGAEVEVEALPEEDTPRTRSTTYHRLLGVRYGLDRLSDSFDYSTERPTGDEKPRNLYERRSAYGERLQRLVSRLTVSWAEAVCREELFVTDWAHEDLAIIYVHEVARIWHVWGSQDFEQVDFDAENLEEFGRLALFYESYKPRPREQKEEWGRLRVYKSSEGLTASRALLLPDFDYDAAQTNGFFSVPSRDCMLVIEPAKNHRDHCLKVLQARTEEEFESALLPFSNSVVELHRTEVGGVAEVGAARPGSISDDDWRIA